MNELLRSENISYSIYSNQKVNQILKGISFSLTRNEIIGISGESGSGKTTLAKIIAGLIIPSRGKVIYSGKKRLNGKIKTNPIQILFQNNGEILNPLREVDEIIKEAISRTGESDVRNKMEEIFRSLDFPEHLWKRKGFELSGGEQQRAALARILAVNPELLILDEPFSAQDPESQFNLLNLFLSLNKKYDISMIFIAHNLRILRKLCSEIIVLYKGEIVEQRKTEELFNSPQHPYTKFLLKAENYDLTYEELNYENSN